MARRTCAAAGGAVPSARRQGRELDPGPPGGRDVEAREAGDPGRLPGRAPGRLEPGAQRLDVGNDEGGVGLARGGELLLDADVELLRPRAEPGPAAAGEALRLRQLLEPEQLAEEAPRLVLAARRRRELDVVQAEDPSQGSHSRRNGTSRSGAMCAYASRGTVVSCSTPASWRRASSETG